MSPVEKTGGSIESHWNENFRPELQNVLSAFEHAVNNPIMIISLSLSHLEKARDSGDAAKIEEKLQTIEDAKNSMIEGLTAIKESLENGKLASDNKVNSEIIEKILNFLKPIHKFTRNDVEILESLLPRA